MLGLGVMDLLLVIAVLFVAVTGLFKHGGLIFRDAVLVLLGVVLVHLLIAGPRWQVLPAYAALIIAMPIVTLPKRWLRFMVFPFVLTLLAVSVLASWAFPVFEIPEPTGDYAVGKTTVFLTDENRVEAYAEAESDHRKLALKVWYPTAAPETGSDGVYWNNAFLRSRAVTNGTPLPWFTFTHLGQVETHAREGAAIATDKFPVVIYSHGLGIGWSSGNTPLLEDLASRGYIVIAIGHSFIGSATIFPEDVAYFDPATRTAMNTEPPAEVMAVHGKVKELTDPKEQLAAFMEAMSMMPVSIKGKVDAALETQVQDQLFVIDSLASLKSEDINVGAHVQENAVGVFGMSIGGSAALITCSRTDRCGAVVNLDGFHPDQAVLKTTAPLLILRRPDNLMVIENAEMAESDAYVVEIADTTHFNFFDFTIMSPLYERLGVLGSIDGREMVSVMREFLGEFFDHYLRGEESGLLDGSESPSSENVVLDVRRAGGA